MNSRIVLRFLIIEGTYIERHIASNPDLYGPFWIALTLSFAISICYDIRSPTSTLSDHFQFEFSRIKSATTLTFTYLIMAPIVLWSFCQWRGCTKMYTFMETVCAYGYSLSIFVPVTLLCALFPLRQLQFIMFVAAQFLSGTVLLINFAPVVHSDPNSSFKFAYIILIFILVAHFTLGLIYLYWFL